MLLGKVTILGDVPSVKTLFKKCKMNAIANTFLLAGDKFMPEMHLRQPEFTFSAGGSSTKSKERIQKFQETGDSRHIYQSELDNVCF